MSGGGSWALSYPYLPALSNILSGLAKTLAKAALKASLNLLSLFLKPIPTTFTVSLGINLGSVTSNAPPVFSSCSFAPKKVCTAASALPAGRADAAVQTFFGAKEHEEKTGGAFEVTDPKLMPKETVNVVGIGFRKSDSKFREAFNAALAKVLANPDKMLERAGKYGYDKAQLPPPDMTTEWACSTK